MAKYMEMSPSTSRRLLTALAAVLVCTAIILVGLNALNIETGIGFQTPNKAALDAKFNEGYLAARAKYIGICPIIGREQKSFSGTVVSISNNQIVINTTQLDSNPSSDLTNQRILALTDETTIQRVMRKPSDQFVKELAANTEHGTIVSPVTRTPMQLSELRKGDEISVDVNEDARTIKELTATSVSLLTKEAVE